MVNKDFTYFLAKMPSLYKKYGHQFLAIKNQQVLGAYATFKEALDETMKTEDLGTFLVQECFKNKEAAVNYFQGNVTFAKAR